MTRAGTWSQAHLSHPRQQLAATAIGNLILAAGGEEHFAPTDVVDLYEPSSGVWSTSTLSEPRRQLAAASNGTQALFAGGNGQGLTSLDTVDIYDAASQ